MKLNYLPNQYRNNSRIKINHSYLVEQFSDYRKILRKMEGVAKKADYTLGDQVNIFEKKISKRMGSKYTISVGNGTDALFLVLKALNIGKGDEVITTPFTFIATTASIVTAGAKPVFVDIKEDYNINEKLESIGLTSSYHKVTSDIKFEPIQQQWFGHILLHNKIHLNLLVLQQVSKLWA